MAMYDNDNECQGVRKVGRSHVVTAADRIEKAIAGLADSLDALGARLEPVMGPSFPLNKDEQAKDVAESQSDFATRLNYVAERLGNLRYGVDGWLDRIEV